MVLVLLGFRAMVLAPGAFYVLAMEGHILAMERAARAAPSPAETWLTYDFRVPREELSTQADEPLLFHGTVMDEEHPQWDRYGPAIQRYPDTLSCLRPEEREAARPNLLAYDWHRIRSHQVCLFRVASTLGSVERVRAWMAASDMRLDPLFHWRGSPPRETAVMGHWTLDEANERSSAIGLAGRAILGFFQWLDRRDAPDIDFDVAFRVDFEADGQVSGTEVTHTAPLN